MSSIRYFLLYSSLSINLFACAQSKPAVKNIYATYTEHLPGNIPVDRNGNTISTRDTLNVIYIETTSEKIQWNIAWKNDKNYSILATLITSPFDAGVNKITNKKMILRSAKGNKLWQLQLVPGEKKSSAPFNILPGEIILQGIYHGEKITLKIAKQTELSSMPSV